MQNYDLLPLTYLDFEEKIKHIKNYNNLINKFEKINKNLIKKQKIILNDETKIISSPAVEYYLSKYDKYYFFNNYCKVLHPVKGIIPFKIFAAQRRFIEAIENHRFVITLKTRQAGFSTVLALYSLWLVNFYKSKVIECFSIGQDESVEVYNRLKRCYDYLPFFLRCQTKHETQTEIETILESKFASKPSTITKGSGQSLSILIIDEASKIPHIENMWAAIYPTLSTGGKCVVNSTPNGLGNWYANMFIKAEKNENEFFPVRTHWWEIPDRDNNDWIFSYEKNDFSFLKNGESFEEFLTKFKNNSEWVKSNIKNLGYDKFLQEYEGLFLGSGKTVLTNETLKELQEETEYATILEENGIKQLSVTIPSLQIYHYPEKDEEYLIFNDVASGRGKDFSASIVFSITKKRQVAEFYDRISPHNFAIYIKQLAKFYNNAYVLIESNAVGLTTLTALLNEDDKNTYYSNVYFEYKNLGYRSVEMTAKIREELLLLLANLIENKEIKIYSKRFVNELLSFVWKQRGMKLIPIAEEGSHDDLIMAFCQLSFYLNYISKTKFFTPLGVMNYEGYNTNKENNDDVEIEIQNYEKEKILMAEKEKKENILKDEIRKQIGENLNEETMNDILNKIGRQIGLSPNNNFFDINVDDDEPFFN